MKRSIVCLIATETQAEDLVGELLKAGFSEDDISVLFPDQGTTRDFAHKKETKMPEGATIGASTGGAVGGAIGLLAGIGALAIPGLGPFIAAGPIIGALSGGAIGAGVGGIAGALIGLGIPEYEAKRYEGKVREGGILVSVHAESKEEVTRAKEVFKAGGGYDISSAEEASADATNQKETQWTSDEAVQPSAIEDDPTSRRIGGRGGSPIKSSEPFVTAEQIQLRAYFIAERRRSSGVAGDQSADWDQAEQELRAEAAGS
jgi:hypothetical protein